MEFKGFKINIIILVVAIVISLFFSIQYIIKIYNVDKPIKNDILELKEVKNVSIVNNNDKIDLLIDFHSGIDFYKSYQKVSNIMKERLGEKSGKIKISEDDKAKEELVDIFYDLHYAIYQGINTGRFVEMEKNVESILKSYEIDNHKLWVNNDAIFIQLDKDKNSLYRRIPYNSLRVTSEGGGGIG